MSHSIRKKSKLIKVFTKSIKLFNYFLNNSKIKKTDKRIFGKQHIRFQMSVNESTVTPTKLKSINDTLQMLYCISAFTRCIV